MAQKKEKSSDLVSVKFKISPIGAFGLAYFEGQVAELEAKIADELVNAEFAEYCESAPVELVAVDDDLTID